MLSRRELRLAAGTAAWAALIALASTATAQQPPQLPGQQPPPGQPGQTAPPVARPQPAPPPAPPIAGRGPAPTDVYRLRAVVFELALPLDRVASFDAEELTKDAATPAACEKLLANMGATRVLYHVDQTLSALRPRTEIGVDRPVVTGRVTGHDGKPIPSVSRQASRAEIELTCMPPGESQRMQRVIAQIEFSSVVESGVGVADDLQAPMTRRVVQTWAGEADGAPALLVAINADEGRSSATAFVTWLSITRIP